MMHQLHALSDHQLLHDMLHLNHPHLPKKEINNGLSRAKHAIYVIVYRFLEIFGSTLSKHLVNSLVIPLFSILLKLPTNKQENPKMWR